MSNFPDNSQNEASSAAVSKRRSKNGVQAATPGTGECRCKARNVSAQTADPPPSPETATVEKLRPFSPQPRATTGTATMEKTLPPAEPRAAAEAIMKPETRPCDRRRNRGRAL